MTLHDSTLAHQRKLAELAPERVGSVAMGARREFAARVRELVETDREHVMEHLAESGAAKEFIDAVVWGCKQRPPDRTCMNLRAQIMKSIEQDRHVIHEVWHKLGVRDEGEAAGLIATAKSAEGVSPHEAAQKVAEWLVAYFNVHPERQAPIIKFLGGVVPVEMG